MSWIQGVGPFHMIYIKKVTNAIGNKQTVAWQELQTNIMTARQSEGPFSQILEEALCSILMTDGHSIGQACGQAISDIWLQGRKRVFSLRPVCKTCYEGGKSKNLKKQVNEKTLQNGVVHSKYTLIIISLFNLRSPCPFWSPQNFFKVYLFLFMCVSVFCMCIWALHVCLLLMEA